jgi:hypothetical protein
MKAIVLKALAVSAITTVPAIATAAPVMPAKELLRVPAERVVAPVELADARDYRHCHSVHTRVYCHKSDRLPMTSKPFSDRTAKIAYDGRSGERPQRASMR